MLQVPIGPQCSRGHAAELGSRSSKMQSAKLGGMAHTVPGSKPGSRREVCCTRHQQCLARAQTSAEPQQWRGQKEPHTTHPLAQTNRSGGAQLLAPDLNPEHQRKFDKARRT